MRSFLGGHDFGQGHDHGHDGHDLAAHGSMRRRNDADPRPCPFVAVIVAVAVAETVARQVASGAHLRLRIEGYGPAFP